MAKDEIANTIMEERLVIAQDIVKRVFVEKGKLKLTDYELADLICRVGNTLFIEKNKAYRTSQIKRD